jgi:hypothetical protein
MTTNAVTQTPTPEHAATRASGARARRWGWRLYWANVAVTGLVGLVFAQSMRLTAGPYTVDERYPFGDAERAYQVTVGFDWIAYAILLAVAGVAIRRTGGRGLWALFALSFVVLWFPHVLIGAALVLNGS